MRTRHLLAAAIVAAVIASGLSFAQYATLVYREQGGAKMVAASGGEIEIQSGGTLDVQSGATLNLQGLTFSSTELGYLDGVTAGTAAANKAVVLGASLEIATLGAVTMGALTADSAAIGGGYGSTGATISTAGVGQFNGALTTDGLLTAALGATVSGAAISLNNDSNFGVNIGTGTSSGAVAIGGGSGTLAINTTSWDISTAGAVTGIGDITAITGLTGGWDLAIAAAAADTAGGTLDVTGQAGGAASTDQVGKNGGAVTITGGAGSAKDGAGANDGDGGDLVLLGGAKGGSTGGGEVDGIVRIGSPTVGSTKATNLLAVAGGLEVDGAARLDSSLVVANSAALDGGITVDTTNFTVDGSTGAVVTASSLTADSAAIGGGYGSTGASISNAGNVQANGALTIDGASTLTGGLTAAADVTVSAESTGGNAGAINQFIGVPRIALVGIGTMANGTTNTVLTDIGDSETPATDWTAIDADTTMSNDGTYYRQGSASLKMVLGAGAAATDGCTNTLTSGDQDWTDDEAVGMWVYATATFDADDLNFVITDGGAGDSTVQFPAYTVANKWQWMEVNISGIANASKDVITDLSIELNAASDLIGSEASLYFDFIVKWDVGEEEDLGQAIQTDGVLSLTMVDATTAAATSANLTLYTDYFVHYQSGNDAIVIISDQSDADKVGLALIAY